jgi:cell division protein FtsW
MGHFVWHNKYVNLINIILFLLGTWQVRRKGRSKFKRKTGEPDYFLLALTGFFLIFGLLMIFEASIYNADEFFNNRFYFVQQQLIWIVVGLIGGAVAYFWDYRQYSKLAVPAMIIVTFLLILILVIPLREPGSGCGLICVRAVNGAKRWLNFGGIAIQPAELMKPVFILYLCSWLSKDRKGFKDFKEALRYHFVYELLAFLALLGLVGGLIIAEPDLGTTLLICFVAFVIYFSSGKDYIHTLGSILIIIVGGALGAAAALLEGYRLRRVKTFLDLLLKGEVTDPMGAGYQMQQILIGIGSGGFFGKGFGESRQRFGYLVENTAFTDSIFAIILEEMGMIGGIILILMFLVFLFRAYNIAVNAPDKLGKLLAGGIALWLVTQAFMHMAANVGLMPLTGVPLTFLSYGGSSTVVSIVGVGILLNVSKFSAK